MSNRLILACLLLCAAGPAAAEKPIRTGTVKYQPAADESGTAEIFRLAAHEFSFAQKRLETSDEALRMFEVTFPSPVETPYPENNTVHTEYFRPAAPGQYPAVIVLHILGGDFELSRLFCRTLAHHDICALFVKLPYYGPRRPANGPRRMVSTDPHQTVAGMTQAVLDIRRGRAWLAAQDEIDGEQTGIFGISLGGITCALAGSAEPRFTKVCPMLAGGDIGQVSWTAKELQPIRERWLADGGTRESFFEFLRPIDPATHASNLRGRKCLFLNAKFDEVIPPACTDSLWHAAGEPPIVWYDAGHYTAMRFIFDGLSRVTTFFGKEE
ncbi:MAG: alpha/beta hydrolase [Pirellulales bacterium]